MASINVHGIRTLRLLRLSPLIVQCVRYSEAKGVVAQKEPFEVELISGKKYHWCLCGRSRRQPFCDGSHKTTDLRPLQFTADKDETVWLCGCKQTETRPFCDGTHGTPLVQSLEVFKREPK